MNRTLLTRPQPASLSSIQRKRARSGFVAHEELYSRCMSALALAVQQIDALASRPHIEDHKEALDDMVSDLQEMREEMKTLFREAKDDAASGTDVLRREASK